MTEADWIACTDPQKMLEFLRGKASERKLRLFACACVRRVGPVLPQGLAQEVVRLSEDYADGKATSRDVGRLRKPARQPIQHPSTWNFLALAPLLRPEFSWQDASRLAEAVTRFVGWDHRGGRPVQYIIHPEVVQAESQAQTALLRDIFGFLPFRPVTLGPARPTLQGATMLKLAQAIYQERPLATGCLDRGRLAVLAGALEKAGYENPDILGHCRAPGPHVPGCWVIDAILGKT